MSFGETESSMSLPSMEDSAHLLPKSVFDLPGCDRWNFPSTTFPDAGPMVRIRFPPVASLRTIGSAVGRMVLVSEARCRRVAPYRVSDQFLVAAPTEGIRAVEKVDADLACAAQGVYRAASPKPVPQSVLSPHRRPVTYASASLRASRRAPWALLSMREVVDGINRVAPRCRRRRPGAARKCSCGSPRRR
jgi:hypothetical protein